MHCSHFPVQILNGWFIYSYQPIITVPENRPVLWLRLRNTERNVGVTREWLSPVFNHRQTFYLCLCVLALNEDGELKLMNQHKVACLWLGVCLRARLWGNKAGETREVNVKVNEHTCELSQICLWFLISLTNHRAQINLSTLVNILARISKTKCILFCVMKYKICDNIHNAYCNIRHFVLKWL